MTTNANIPTEATRLKMVHFHHTDGRFCGTSEQARQFSFDPNAVTCSHCKGRDAFALSPRAAQWVESESYRRDMIEAGRGHLLR